MADLEPGWLMRTCHEAHIRCMADNSPSMIKHITKTVTPIPPDEARELYDLLNTRFKSWTGLDLSQMAAPEQIAKSHAPE